MIIADESLNNNLIISMRNAGYEVLSVAEEFRGISDEEVALKSLSPASIIISEDKDFGELAYHYKVSLIGIILLRYAPGEVEIIKKMLLSFLEDHVEKLTGKFAVINVNKIRIRSL